MPLATVAAAGCVEPVGSPRDETVMYGSLRSQPAADPAQLDLAEQPDEDESRDGEEDHKP